MKQERKLLTVPLQSGLKQGYTTGSCAAAASLAAASLLFLGERRKQVSILTPKGIRLTLAVEEEEAGEGWVRCAVRKSSGDDPDITDGVLVYACVARKPDCTVTKPVHGQQKSPAGNDTEENAAKSIIKDAEENTAKSTIKRITESAAKKEEERWYTDTMHDAYGSLTLYLRGGLGIGRVTRPGLSCPVGMWAINPVPRKMVFEQVARVCQEAEVSGEVWITLEIPQGIYLAEKTFNPRLGIVGGLSVLGSSGIVEPMSEPALLETIRLEIRQRAMEGQDSLLLVPGNYGEKFIKETLALPVEKAVKCSNYIGQALDMAAEEGMKKVLLVGHAGKLIKLAGGIMNTHSRVADGRMECLAACSAACGASQDMVIRILNCITIDEALGLLSQKKLLFAQTMEFVLERMGAVLMRRAEGRLQPEAVVFTNAYGLLGMTRGAEAMIRQFLQESP